MILLSSHDLIVNITAVDSIDYAVDYCDHATAGATDGVATGPITATGDTGLVSGVGGAQRQVRQISIVNTGATTATFSVRHDDGLNVTPRSPVIDLRPGEMLVYRDGADPWQVITREGAIRKTTGTVVLSTQGIPFYKIGTAPEAAGVLYCSAKDTGGPSTWSPGSPGLSGRVTDGTSAGDAGCLPIAQPSSGQHYIQNFTISASVVMMAFLYDFLWVNTGINVTTTTAQTVNSVTLPARDRDGTTAGEGVFAALLVTTATTNVAANTAITMSYTNSAGTPGRTATMPSFPATANLGTFVLFHLQPGDTGIQSIQSINLGTTLTAGAISLVLFRQVAAQPVSLANAGSFASPQGSAIYAQSCLILAHLATATTASTIYGQLSLEERV